MPNEALQGIGGSLTSEEVIGYRAWNVRKLANGGAHLHSPVYTYVWTPGGRRPTYMSGEDDGWYWAECEGAGKVGSGGHEHRNDHPDPKMWVPVKDCGGSFHGCGFYAGRTHAHLIDLGYAYYADHHPTVIGRIQMEGKVIPASNGFRAQKVRIQTIYVPHQFWELANALKKTYEPQGAEVELWTTIIAQDTPEWCKHCGAKMPPRTHMCGLCRYDHK